MRAAVTVFLVLGLLLMLNLKAMAADYPVLPDMGSEEAIRMADNILSWQTEHGGWDKNQDFSKRARKPGEPGSTHQRNGVELATFDNAATISELRFLALVYQATGLRRFKEGFQKGLDFILEAQYPSGGWPQFYPRRGNYSDYVTFNDNAMINVMTLVRDVLTDPLYSFVDPEYRPRLQQALDKGIEFILKSQIRVGSRLTAWCAQHDPVTYEPRPGRSYEHVSISGSESVAIVEFLMEILDPSVEIRRAILSALQWLEEVRLADGTWARFYEIGTNRPIFSGRDGIIKYDIMEIEEERRRNYRWFVTTAESLFPKVRLNGYMEELFHSLPAYPVPFIKFIHPEIRGTSASHLLPVEVDVLCKEGVQLRQVGLYLDNQCIYLGSKAPQGKVVVDISAFENGYHELRASVKFGQGEHTTLMAKFRVENTWELMQEFRPPSGSGWLGTIDYLKASERSSGWEYLTDQAELFGDLHRLAPTGSKREYLTWDTPELLSFFGAFFVQGDRRLDEIMELAVAGADGKWRVLPYAATVEEVGDGWAKAQVSADLTSSLGTVQFRLAKREGVPGGCLQLGRMHFVGRNTAVSASPTQPIEE